jgi:hypothetical protein
MHHPSIAQVVLNMPSNPQQALQIWKNSDK